MACDNGKHDVVDETTAIRAAAEVAQKYKLLVRAVIALAFGFFVMVGCCIWAVVNAQTIANEAMIQALNTVGEMEVVHEESTTTQTVDGDSATINNVEGEQHNDNAQNGGGE